VEAVAIAVIVAGAVVAVAGIAAPTVRVVARDRAARAPGPMNEPSVPPMCTTSYPPT
jgi:hypothetical protein